MTDSSHGSADYRSAGVDYEALDAGKRRALTAALSTSPLMAQYRGGLANDASRGEPSFVFSLGGQTFGFVVEGLGTKSIIARQVHEQLGKNLFRNVAYDTVAAIVNDLCCSGALPVVVNAYFSTGSSDWYIEHADRNAAVVDGWQEACSDARATWGGGESPSLSGLVDPREIELAGSAVGLVPGGRAAILGQDLAAGDEIVIVASSGLHANGASLARLLSEQPGGGYATLLSDGTTFGEALLEPTILYSPLVERLLAEDLQITYLSHITGHGLLKLMRPSRGFTYRITTLPDVPPVLAFMAERARMTPAAAYSTLNMGCGFAVYCSKGSGRRVVEIARELGLSAIEAGVVEDGPRRVILEEQGVEYGSDALDLTPRREP
jgi:phosphoribosylformylglycinamidine cyclo-ligase